MKNADMPAYASQVKDYGNGVKEIITGGGLTKREYFAAMAMQAVIAHPKGLAGQWNFAARDALIAADALLEALDND